MTNSQALLWFQERAEPHLHKIEKLLSPDAKLTLIVRVPGNDEGDIMLTIDDPREVQALVARRIAATTPPAVGAETEEGTK